ncbi:hypothetical protein FNFX1_0127 [Francisella cf. novicida Fx1]|nr:hypothetical protein FNFX1_0127 [Francisella cf. novicida Fx1]
MKNIYKQYISRYLDAQSIVNKGFYSGDQSLIN